MRNKILLSVFAVLLIFGLAASALSLPSVFAAENSQASDPNQPTENAPLRTISVNGSGKVTLDPDIATINIGVHTENTNAQEAVAQNNEDAQAVIDALKGFGIADKDIQTSNFSIYPRQDYDNEGQVRGITYVVDNSVMVKVRDLESIGAVLDATVKAGANSINGIQFSVEDPSAAYEAALGVAVESARNRAEVLAQAAGVELGEVQTISTYIGGVPTPYYGDIRIMAEAAAAEVPISPGQTDITVDVNVVYFIQ